MNATDCPGCRPAKLRVSADRDLAARAEQYPEIGAAMCADCRGRVFGDDAPGDFTTITPVNSPPLPTDSSGYYINPAPAGPPPSLPALPAGQSYQTVKYGAQGALVVSIQNALNAAGRGPLVVDGVWGDSTQAAVNAFQLGSPGLVNDGIVGPQTAAALGITLPLAGPNNAGLTSASTPATTGPLAGNTGIAGGTGSLQDQSSYYAGPGDSQSKIAAAMAQAQANGTAAQFGIGAGAGSVGGGTGGGGTTTAAQGQAQKDQVKRNKLWEVALAVGLALVVLYLFTRDDAKKRSKSSATLVGSVPVFA